MNDQDDLQISRRRVLQLVALASASLAAACNEPAQGNDSGLLDVTPTDATGADVSDTGTQVGADVASLNGLLTAEYHAIKAYDAGATILMNPPAGDPLASLAPTLLQVAARFQSQHRDHAALLATTITGMGGTPIDAATVTFVAPPGFTGTVTNVLKLACNAEKAAAVGFTRVVSELSVASNRFLAATIEGDEAQHYIVLFVLLQGLAQPGPNISTNVASIVPTSFVAMIAGMMGLQSVPDYSYA